MKNIVNQISRSFLRYKANIIVLALLLTITSFMYFFVQYAIDGNYRILLKNSSLSQMQEEFRVALESNSILAKTLLLFLFIITAAIILLFMKRYIRENMDVLGIFLSLGYKISQVYCVFIGIILVFSAACTVAGSILGRFGSEVLLNTYRELYGFDNIIKGIELSNYLIGTLLVSIGIALVTRLSFVGFARREIADSLAKLEASKTGGAWKKASDKIAVAIPGKYSFSSRIMLRKPLSLLIMFFSVFIFLTLFILGISLYNSSKVVYRHLIKGKDYQYDVTYDEVREENGGMDQGYYLKVKGELAVKNDKASIHLIGISSSEYFRLYDLNAKEIQLNDNSVIISQQLKEVHNLAIGDTIQVTTDEGKNEKLIISDISVNADNNMVYMSRKTLAKNMSMKEEAYNGYFGDEPADSKTDAKIATKAQYLETLNGNVVSNRNSAVIDQILGIVVGGLLLFLSILLLFQDNEKNIHFLYLQGYTEKEIHQMLINIYHPIINISGLISIPLSIRVCQFIQKQISVQTNDYIPFSSNIWIILLGIVLANIIYLLIQRYYKRKMERICYKEEKMR